MRLLDVDPVSGSWEEFDYDDAEDLIIYKRYQDVEPVLDINKNLLTNDWSRKEWMWHAAQIPNIFVEKWINEDGVNVMKKENWPWLRRKLNDSEWRWLRVHEFNV
jgi:hypothetical protein